jgi:hypothetical protein
MRIPDQYLDLFPDTREILWIRPDRVRTVEFGR